MPPGQSACSGQGVQSSPEPHAQRVVVEEAVEEEEEEEEEDAKLERIAEQASGGA